ncbi:polymerase delta-interacting protein 2 isoform X1 [Lucilia cuprina]|uniref:polymerase delta-interacting protein 2 isoform X1 n=1 Tax=Lucilia cuprina TaxID=7375 RepID=UPI001F057F35|nr:polymerase delta-interacting protein 2 isoform X1 [Lucilia cuprina]XP_046804752.1 polymerase delta-interacting protein 2 isoform X1 [Lucilia cuprina]XP_046804753.1 polymerase delta-interacting protein 2 isoform X1 [Lucilia cuprina]
MGFLQQILWTQNQRKSTALLQTVTVIISRSIKKHSQQARLAEVGRLEPAKSDGKYETGQLFLHRIFGYRGVVLFPWTARVYDRDLHNPNKTKTTASGNNTTAKNAIKGKSSGTASETTAKTGDKTSNKTNSVAASLKSHLNDVVNTLNVSADSSDSASASDTSKSSENPTKPNAADSTNDKSSNAAQQASSTSPQDAANTKEVKGKVHTFYQVLIDSRDCPYIRAQTEAVTFLGNQDSNRSLYAIPGLDYVSHDDIMPYSSAEKNPLHHELFDKFLTYVPDKQPCFEPKDTLKTWQEKNHPWLELSDVHKETTENIRVTVIPFYMGCRETPASSVYWWRYSIRLENLGNTSVQLRERHWRIFSLSGTLETVRGRGVVGQEPILSPRLPAFQYSSHVSLQAPSGHMWGTFRLEREDGHMFDCKIPPFSLESKPEEPPAGQTKKTD